LSGHSPYEGEGLKNSLEFQSCFYFAFIPVQPFVASFVKNGGTGTEVGRNVKGSVLVLHEHRNKDGERESKEEPYGDDASSESWSTQDVVINPVHWGRHYRPPKYLPLYYHNC
jgi:hypothetical protein